MKTSIDLLLKVTRPVQNFVLAQELLPILTNSKENVFSSQKISHKTALMREQWELGK